MDRAGRALGRDACLRRTRGEPLPAGQSRHVRRVFALPHRRSPVPERGADSRSPMKAIALALLPLLLTDVVLPAGTHIPIRFVQRVTSGRDTVGTPVLVQTIGAVVRDSCVIVPPYLRVTGRVVVSKGGGRFGRHGRLGLRFDSPGGGPGPWGAVSAVLYPLE